MPVPINEGLVSRGLVGLFGIKGRFRPQLDETEVPVVITSQLDRSPFQLTKPCGASLAVGAVAAENGYIGVLPAAGLILCIDKILFNQGGTQPVFVQRLTVANLVTIGAPFSSVFLRDFNNIEPPQANGPRTSSLIQSNSFVGVVGDEVAQTVGQANVRTVFDFPDGYFLYGNDPAGIDMLACVGVVNLGITASFFCREFRLPG